MNIRVITVAYNPGTELEKFAQSLRNALGDEYEFVIVDNGEEHALAHEVAAKYDATYLCPGENLGYGRAANLGAEGFSGRWLFVINPDAELRPGCLDALIEEASRWPKGGAFGPLIETPEGEVYPSARSFPRVSSGVGHALFADIWPENPWTRAYRANADIARAHTVDWLSGACLMLRREAFEQIEGFDESYFMFFEDVELGEDLAHAGWESVFVPQARVVHDQGASWRERPEAMICAHHKSAAHYLDGVYAGPLLAPLRWACRAGLRARAAFLTRGK